MKQKITKFNLKAIHGVACSGWKTKIEEYAKREPFDDEIELTQGEICEMFDASDNEQKKVLSKFFTRPESIMDKVKSFKDACIVLGVNEDDVFNKKTDASDDIAFKKLKIIAKVLNEGWYPNWSNANEYKYFIWWKMEGGFSSNSVIYHLHYSATAVPSALCFNSRELAEHMSNIAFNEFKEYYS
jgi:hypothetical protein